MYSQFSNKQTPNTQHLQTLDNITRNVGVGAGDLLPPPGPHTGVTPRTPRHDTPRHHTPRHDTPRHDTPRHHLRPSTRLSLAAA